VGDVNENKTKSTRGWWDVGGGGGGGGGGAPDIYGQTDERTCRS